MSTTIKTDHKWKKFLYGYEVPARIMQTQFDYLDDENGALDGFIKYHGRYLHMSEFMRIDENSPFRVLGWQAHADDTYFSCYLLKISNDGEEYQIGFAYC